jgi:hypothetical protein
MTYIIPQNLTNLGLLLQYVNNIATEGYFGVGILIALYSILFLNLKIKGELTEDCLITAGWITIISSIFIYLMRLIGDRELFICMALLVIPLIWAYMNKE